MVHTQTPASPPPPSPRGGDWFNHKPYEPTQQRLLEWLDDSVERKLKVAVVEVGVGGNTPVVTHIPAMAWASAVAAAGGHATYIRINPDLGAANNGRGSNRDGRALQTTTEGLTRFDWAAGWRALGPVAGAVVELRNKAASRATEAGEPGLSRREGELGADGEIAGDATAKAHYQQRYTSILYSLRTPR